MAYAAAEPTNRVRRSPRSVVPYAVVVLFAPIRERRSCVLAPSVRSYIAFVGSPTVRQGCCDKCACTPRPACQTTQQDHAGRARRTIWPLGQRGARQGYGGCRAAACGQHRSTGSSTEPRAPLAQPRRIHRRAQSGGRLVNPAATAIFERIVSIGGARRSGHAARQRAP